MHSPIIKDMSELYKAIIIGLFVAHTTFALLFVLAFAQRDRLYLRF